MLWTQCNPDPVMAIKEIQNRCATYGTIVDGLDHKRDTNSRKNIIDKSRRRFKVLILLTWCILQKVTVDGKQ